VSTEYMRDCAHISEFQSSHFCRKTGQTEADLENLLGKLLPENDERYPGHQRSSSHSGCFRAYDCSRHLRQQKPLILLIIEKAIDLERTQHNTATAADARAWRTKVQLVIIPHLEDIVRLLQMLRSENVLTDEELLDAEKISQRCLTRIACHFNISEYLTFYLSRLLEDCFANRGAVYLLKMHCGLAPMHVAEDGFEASHKESKRFFVRCTTKLGGKERLKCLKDELLRAFRMYCRRSASAGAEPPPVEAEDVAVAGPDHPAVAGQVEDEAMAEDDAPEPVMAAGADGDALMAEDDALKPVMAAREDDDALMDADDQAQNQVSPELPAAAPPKLVRAADAPVHASKRLRTRRDDE